jgi:hypothetical protein
MMKFKTVNETVAVAINSLKEVRIERIVDVFNYDRNLWMVHTPDGGLDDKFTTRGPFISFEAAKRNAEMNVGFTWKELADALNG